MYDKLINCLNEAKIKIQKSDKPDDVLKRLNETLMNDLEKLMLARLLLERTLTYVRYHAKALKEG